MKFFLLSLVLLFGFIFTSCENNPPDNVYHTKSGYDVIYNPNFFYEIRVTKIEYDGHNYIMFQSGQGRESTMGVTHDPNCPNHENKVEDNNTVVEENDYLY